MSCLDMQINREKISGWIKSEYKTEIRSLQQSWGTDGMDEVMRRMFAKLDNYKFPSEGEMRLASYNAFTEALLKYLPEREKENN